jgi:hypothetical protein
MNKDFVRLTLAGCFILLATVFLWNRSVFARVPVGQKAECFNKTCVINVAVFDDKKNNTACLVEVNDTGQKEGWVYSDTIAFMGYGWQSVPNSTVDGTFDGTYLPTSCLDDCSATVVPVTGSNMAVTGTGTPFTWSKTCKVKSK